MTIEKSARSIKNTEYSASGSFTATAGQTIKLETSPGGEEIFTDDVPAGKVWSVSTRLVITETDA